MNINIICIGKLKEKYLIEAQKEYTKRISGFSKINIIQLNDEKLSGKESEDFISREKEGDNILSKIPKNSYVISMDLNGKEYDSMSFAKNIERLNISGKSNFTFIIGGSTGISEKVLSISDEKISFSKLTFPHQLFRIMLLEQIYRSFKINNGHSYHK